MTKRLSPDIKEAMLDLLSNDGRSNVVLCKQLRDVVPIEQWIKDPYYVGEDGSLIYDYWIDQIVDVFTERSKPYTEVIITGSLGGGKSMASLYMMLRKLYELSCYENIANKFGLMTTSSIVFAYFSVAKYQAMLTGFGQFRSMIDSIPYFYDNFRRDEKVDSILRFPENLQFIFASNSSHTIGMNLLGSILDEANFYQGSSAQAPTSTSQFEYSKITNLYSSIVNRQKSRFMSRGSDPSLSILVSSATHSSSFTVKRIQQSKSDPTVKIIDAKIWETKPKGTYSDKKFYVFKGSDALDPFVVESSLDVKRYLDTRPDIQMPVIAEQTPEEVINSLPFSDQTSFISLPVDFKKNFIEGDIILALQDIAGESVAPQGKLFTSRMHYNDAVVQYLQHPFIKEEICLPTNSNIQLFQYLKKDYKFRDTNKPHYLHIDQSTTNDCTGISMAHIFMTNREGGESKPIICVDFMLRIVPPRPPQKISISKVREFIFYLRDILEINIEKVTYDQAFSAESLQILEEAGFNCGRLSVDRTDEQYLALCNLFYEGRIQLYDYSPFRKELFDLVHDRDRNKVDHPVGSCLLPWTKVHVFESRDIAIEKLIKNTGFYIYSKDSNGLITCKKVKKVWQSRLVTSYYHIVLSSGSSFDVTDNHPIMLSTGKYLPACELKEGLEVMSFRRDYKGKLFSLEERVYEPAFRIWKYSFSFREPWLSIFCNREATLLGRFLRCFKCFLYVFFNFVFILFCRERDSKRWIDDVSVVTCEPTPVYDLEVEDGDNFALSAGLFVHNSKDVADSVCGSVFNALTVQSVSGGSPITQELLYDYYLNRAPQTIDELLYRDMEE